MSNRIQIDINRVREILSDLIDVTIATHIMALNHETPADELREGIDIIGRVVRESGGEIATLFHIGPEVMIPLIISRVNEVFPPSDAESDAKSDDEPDDAAKHVANEILAKMKAGK